MEHRCVGIIKLEVESVVKDLNDLEHVAANDSIVKDSFSMAELCFGNKLRLAINASQISILKQKSRHN